MYGDLGASWPNYQIRFRQTNFARVSPQPFNHSSIILIFLIFLIILEATYTKVEITSGKRAPALKECLGQIFCAEDNGLQFEQVGLARLTTLRGGAGKFLGTRVQT